MKIYTIIYEVYFSLTQGNDAVHIHSDSILSKLCCSYLQKLFYLSMKYFLVHNLSNSVKLCPVAGAHLYGFFAVLLFDLWH